MISFLSLLGLLWNKGQMGTRKEGKKHHLFPSSPGAIRSLSRSFTFPKGLHFPLKHWHFVKKKKTTKRKKNQEKNLNLNILTPPQSKGVFHAFPHSPEFNTWEKKVGRKSKEKRKKGPPQGRLFPICIRQKPLVFCHSFHFLAGSPSCQSPQENAL